MPDLNQDSYQDKLLKTPAPNFSSEAVKNLAQELYGLTGTLTPLGSERDLNFRLDTAAGDQLVIKIANSAEEPAIIDMQLKALEHISRVDPDLPVPEVVLSRNGLAFEQIEAEDGRKHQVRIVTYLPGAPPEDDSTSYNLYHQLGTILARLTQALSGFFHPIANHELLWDLKHTSKLRAYVNHIKDDTHREWATTYLDRFDQNVQPLIPKLRAGIVHNDLVPDNILVADDDPERIVGILDFGDMVHTLLVIDLATSIAASLRGQPDPVGAATHVVAGYHKIIPLEEKELDLLYDLVGARLVMLNIIASWRVTIHPDNEEYIMGGVDHTWDVIKSWQTLDPVVVTRKFYRICGFWEHNEKHPELGKPTQALELLLQRRERLLGPSAYLFYKRPLHIVSGEGVWLDDEKDIRYLDAYNNVPQVGHCHPHVVNAIAKQAGMLNTSTRYLHELILELAERITNRLPDPLSVCLFVCTGSEANELAWRISKLVSGNSGALITKYAYHGSTNATSLFSTETIPESKLPPQIATYYPPTSNTTFQKPDSGIDEAINKLDEGGYQPAMLILDTSFVSDGIYTPPVDYLRTLFMATRAAGGLCVADEVQGGFGRFGKHFWGFQYDDVVPDIVTMGKPMGNGHPIAAVVTRPEIAEILARESGYFNTFGGNPVSCAAGLAVLDVIEKEGLQQNALEVGQYLIERLEGLMTQHTALGSIHGSGLLLGIDVLDSDGKPDPGKADRILNLMREDGVLIGTTGQDSNVLKIRPPLVFEVEHAEILLEALVKALNEA